MFKIKINSINILNYKFKLNCIGLMNFFLVKIKKKLCADVFNVLPIYLLISLIISY